MTEPARTLLDYQREASAAAFPARPEEISAADGEPKWGVAAARLYRAGWQSLVRGGVRIWCEDPDDWRCRWKSEEIAYGIVTREE